MRTSMSTHWSGTGTATTCSILDVCRATSAAPTFFQSIKFSHNSFDDGGFGMNNPSFEILQEIRDTCMTSGETIGLFLSIGTGKAESFTHPHLSISKRSQSNPRSSQTSTNTEKSLTDAILEREIGNYFRISIDSGLEDVKFDDWKSFSQHRNAWKRMRNASEHTVKEAESQIKVLAHRLVYQRQQRSVTKYWERFALGSQYRCTYKDCPYQRSSFENRTALIAHLQAKHGFPPPDRLNYKSNFQDYIVNGFLSRNDTPYPS